MFGSTQGSEKTEQKQREPPGSEANGGYTMRQLTRAKVGNEEEALKVSWRNRMNESLCPWPEEQRL